MAFEIEGTLKVIMDTQTFGSGFTKREFVVTIGDERYPQDIKMELVKDKTALLDKYKIGQRVKIGFDLRGGEHNGRWYVNVQAWRIHPADGSEAPAADGGASRNEPRAVAGVGGAPHADRPRPDSGGEDRGGGGRDRGGRGDRDEDRRPRRQEDSRGGGRRGNNAEDDIDF